ncbi:ABC transporter permease [Gracilinema caldarium]|uniref:ABC transporter permease n=1 Tax=Gracilinema caldarium TaxID=215591 RepID=UPI0026F0BA15|nr:ABC transporter permease [Gracilinema caldarium]
MRSARKSNIADRILDVITRSEAMVSIVVVLLGFLVGTFLVMLVGRNPSGMYSAITQVLTGWDLGRGTWNARYIGEWLVMSLPLILCGLSVAFAGRTGLFNIGAEGQYVAGLTAAQFVAIFGPQIPFVHWMLAILAAIAIGALWGGIVGILKAKYSVSEVVATIMLNYVAYFTSRVLTMMIPGANTYRTPTYPQTARLASPLLEQLTNGSRLNYGFYLALISIIFFWIVIGKTRLGFSLRATGLNKEAARYAGINVNASITTAMAISGAFAGLAGAVVALGSFTYGRVLGGLDGYGFDGIAVALVGNSTAWGTALSGLLFGMLKSAQPLMQSRQIPKEITAIIMGLVVVFISLRAGFRMLMEWRMKEQARKGRVIE